MKAELQHKEPQKAEPIQSKQEKAKLSFVDNRPQTASQTKLIQSIQKKENKTGLPDNLKTGMENLSGFSMDDVRVHYNSSKPAQLNALAYAQGTDIHVAPGQEKHLPHEAWHVVQQKQGRVRPTVQLQGVDVNDNEGLEREADVMGENALQFKVSNETPIKNGDFNNKNNALITQSYILKKIAITSTSTIQKKTIPLVEDKSELNADWVNDIIVYPGITSCIGITVAMDNDTHRLLGTHLVAPYTPSRVDGYVLQLGQIITIVEEANPYEAIVHISTEDGDIEGNIASHLLCLENDDLKTIMKEWFAKLKNNHETNKARWDHIRYDRKKPGDSDKIKTRFPDYKQQFIEANTDYLNVPHFEGMAK